MTARAWNDLPCSDCGEIILDTDVRSVSDDDRVLCEPCYESLDTIEIEQFPPPRLPYPKAPES